MGQFESFIGVDFWTALFVLLNTLAIFLVARKYLFKPVHKMITDRQKEIDDMYADARKAKEDAETMAAEYQRKMSEAQAASDRLMREAAARGQDRGDELVRKAKAEAAAILAKAGQEGEREKRRAINEAKDEIASMALSIAEKVVERELNDADQSALVDRFIDELGEKP